MTRHGCFPAAAVVIALLTPALSWAGPYLGEWGWCWHRAKDCPRGAYSPLHYWAPELYKIRANVHPSNLNQFPPGPYPAVAPTFQTTKFPCPIAPPMVPTPYQDPAGYYGVAPR